MTVAMDRGGGVGIYLIGRIGTVVDKTIGGVEESLARQLRMPLHGDNIPSGGVEHLLDTRPVLPDMDDLMVGQTPQSPEFPAFFSHGSAARRTTFVARPDTRHVSL